MYSQPDEDNLDEIIDDWKDDFDPEDLDDLMDEIDKIKED